MTATPVSKRPTKARRPGNNITAAFRQWLEIKDEGLVLGDRQATLRERLLEAIEEFGRPDEKGNTWLELSEPVSFRDHEGKVFKFGVLKRERHLIPAVKFPDAKKAEALLKKKGSWLTKQQQEQLIAIQDACPYVKISVDVDPDALAKAVFIGKITDREYESTLKDQRENFQFRAMEL